MKSICTDVSDAIIECVMAIKRNGAGCYVEGITVRNYVIELRAVCNRSKFSYKGYLGDDGYWHIVNIDSHVEVKAWDDRGRPVQLPPTLDRDIEDILNS